MRIFFECDPASILDTQSTINSVIDSTLDGIKRTRVRYKSDTKRYNTLEDFFNDMGW
jgi:hypothetical protein